MTVHFTGLLYTSKLTELMWGDLPQPCSEGRTSPRSSRLPVSVRQSFEEPIGSMVMTAQWRLFCAKFNLKKELL